MAYLITDPSDEIYAGSRLTVKANGLTYSSDNDYYEIRVYVDGDIQYTSEITYDREVYTKTYSIPSRASDTVNIQLHQWVSGLGYVTRDAISIGVIADSEESGGSSSGGGNTTIYNPTIGSFDLTPINSSGGTTSIAVQGKTRIQASVSGCTAGSGDIDYYVFSDQNGDSVIYTSASSASTIFSAPTGSGTISYQVRAVNTYGASRLTSRSIYVHPYFAPYFAKFNVYRSNSSGGADISGEYIACEYQVNYSPVNNTNSISIDIYCDGDRIAQNLTNSTYKYVTTDPYDIDIQHNLYAVVTDTYKSSIKSATESVYPSGKILNISANGDSIGIGGLAPSDTGKLQCYWDAQFDKNITLTGTLNGVNMSSWSPPQIQTGTFDITFKNYETYNTGTVTFNSAFSKTPHISITPYIYNKKYSYVMINCCVTNIQTTSFSYSIGTGDNSAGIAEGGNTKITCYWMAIAS